MTKRFANFATRLATGADTDVDVPDVPETPVEPEAEPDLTPDDKEANMADDTPLHERDDYKAGLAAGELKANDRMKAVFASEHFAGREAAAAKYLGTDMTAEQITTVLADLPAAPKVDQAAANAAAEEAARDEMRNAMKANGNADLGAEDGEAEPKSGRAHAESVWADARAYVDNAKKEG